MDYRHCGSGIKTVGKAKRELNRDVLISVSYRMVSVAGDSLSGFEPISDRGGFLWAGFRE